MKKLSYFSLPSVITAILVGVFVGVIGVHAAWGNPTANPPDGNVNLPTAIDTSINAQQKQGALTLQADLSVGNTLSVTQTASFLGNIGLNLDGAYANALVIPSGKVGIGTATPTAGLDVRAMTRLWGGKQALSFGTTYISTSDGLAVATLVSTGGAKCKVITYCTAPASSGASGTSVQRCAIPESGQASVNADITSATVTFPVIYGQEWAANVTQANAGTGQCGGNLVYYPFGSGTSAVPPPPPPPSLDDIINIPRR